MTLDSAVTAQLLIVGGEIVTMNPSGQVVLDATIAIADGRILAIGETDVLRSRFPGTAELDATGCIVVPGLINAHQHTTADPLVRSLIPDNISSYSSIFEWIVPLHQQLSAEDDEIGALLSGVESLSLGVTTLLDPGTVENPLQVAAGLRQAGIRARVGRWGSDTPGMPFAESVEATLAAQEQTVLAVGQSGLVTGWVTLIGHSLASDELFTGAAELAQRIDAPFSFHISPGPDDAVAYLERTGSRPLVHLNRLGVLSPRLVLGHAVHLDDAEIDVLVASGAGVAACPGAYMRLGQKYTSGGRYLDLIRRGGRVAVGCDSHNAGDVPDVLRSAWLLAAVERDRDSGDQLRAHEAFGLATIDGARAIGMADDIGSIEVGKAADIVLMDTRDPAWMPRGDLALQLIWGCPSHTVRDVVVNGEIVVRDRKVLSVDTQAMAQELNERSRALLRRAGIDPPHAWTNVSVGELSS
jgi:5-methylthioadenosine/S-adenosylhomocysteine deaminase